MVKSKLLLSVFFCLYGLNAICQLTSNTKGWTTFYNECSTDFTESFQREMSNQLMEQFNATMVIENCVIEKEFTLSVGFTELKTMYDNNYSFSLVQVNCRNNYSYTITAYWKADDNITITKQDSVNSSQVEFGWCSDFDKDQFSTSSKDNIITEINGTKIQFKYAGNYQLFPDLIINTNSRMI